MNTDRSTFENLPDDKRERVLAVALDEFSDHGYHQASVNRMVKRLGIAKGSLFKYFGSKEGLFEYLFGQAIRRFKGPLKAVRAETAGQPLMERVRASWLAGVAFIEAHPRIYRTYLKVLFQEGFPLREKFLAEVRHASGKYLRPLVAEAAERGELRPGLDEDAVVFLLDAVMDRFLQSLTVPFADAGLGLFGADRAAVERRMDQLIDCIRQGVQARAKDD